MKGVGVMVAFIGTLLLFFAQSKPMKFIGLMMMYIAPSLVVIG